MLCGNPRREKLFREAKLSCEDEKGEGKGSIMAFHGSPCCVWNSIVKDGLEYKWMRNAQAFGPGLYLATDQRTSVGYLRPSAQDTSWPNSALGTTGMCIMAVCEMVNRPESFVGAPGVSSKIQGYSSNSPHYVVQHVGERDHEKYLQTTSRHLYDDQPEFAGEDWVTAKVMMYGEYSSPSGSLCSDSKKLRPPEVGMTPQVAGKANISNTRMTSLDKKNKNRSGGKINRVLKNDDDTERALYLNTQLSTLIAMGFVPHVAWQELAKFDGDLDQALNGLAKRGAMAHEAGSAAEQ